jgi:hypothetical protein
MPAIYHLMLAPHYHLTSAASPIAKTTTLLRYCSYPTSAAVYPSQLSQYLAGLPQHRLLLLCLQYPTRPLLLRLQLNQHLTALLQLILN